MVPPVPIPNTDVKRCRADGSACIACARVGRRQGKFKRRAEFSARLFFFPKFHNQPSLVVLPFHRNDEN